ncbi:MAG TPA: lytic transglycosylase domain-containing protein [Candidatus Sulfotelmatobacter sp.]|nr:lytic transglycosylase domain-containing protein [Candidatus Sulfotelmatobacter sp.]
MSFSLDMRTFSPTRLLILAALMVVPCFAGEVAVLKNGFSIRHERREVIGSATRLYVNADGSSFVDVPTAEIEHFEAALDEPSSSFGLRASSPASSRKAIAGFPSAVPFPARPKTDLTQVVNEASGRYRLDPDLVNSVIKAESAFNVRAVSPKGAQGLMQLMPGTASQLGVPNAFDAQANVDGGTKYLRELLERYNFDLVKALAAYNAGPQKVERFGGVPPYFETRAYVARIVRDFNKKKAAQDKASAATTSANAKVAASKNTPASPKHSANPLTRAKTNTAAD